MSVLSKPQVTSPQAFAAVCARVIADYILAKPDAVVGLSTGRTTGAIHRALVQIIKEEHIDVSQVTFFGLDEVTGVSPDYFGACVWMLLHECILDLGIPPENFLMLPTESEDWERDCAAFTAALRERGGISLLELGLGENGHIGFNQPGTPFTQRCFRGGMHDYLEERIRRETGTPPEKALGGVTLGIADVMEAGELLLCVNGSNKREIMERLANSTPDTALPASVLSLHPNLRVICDENACPGEDLS